MSERFRGVPNPEGASGQHGRQNSKESQTAYTQGEQTYSSPPLHEQIPRFHEMPRNKWRSSKGTLEEIRDLLQDEAHMRQIDECAAMRQKIVDDLNRYREKTQQQTQQGGEKITAGKLALLILAGFLTLPIAAAEQSFKETWQDAD